MRKSLPLCVLTFFISGCYATPQHTPQKSARSAEPARAAHDTSEEIAIASAIAGIKSRASDYEISAADLIEVTVFREEELDRTVRVSQTGEISLPLVGTLKVGGMSLQAAQSLIAEKLGEYLINPQVSVFIKEYGNKKVYVLGEVSKPGSFEIPPESKLTVLEAISMAGGFSAVAAKDRTRVIRSGPDGKSRSWTVEIDAITKQGRKDKDIALEPNDVVYVPQSFF